MIILDSWEGTSERRIVVAGEDAKIWVSLQGNQVSVHSAGSAPSGKHADGEPLIRVWGPFNNAADAKAFADRTAARCHDAPPVKDVK